LRIRRAFCCPTKSFRLFGRMLFIYIPLLPIHQLLLLAAPIRSFPDLLHLCLRKAARHGNRLRRRQEVPKSPKYPCCPDVRCRYSRGTGSRFSSKCIRETSDRNYPRRKTAQQRRCLHHEPVHLQISVCSPSGTDLFLESKTPSKDRKGIRHCSPVPH